MCGTVLRRAGGAVLGLAVCGTICTELEGAVLGSAMFGTICTELGGAVLGLAMCGAICTELGYNLYAVLGLAMRGTNRSITELSGAGGGDAQGLELHLPEQDERRYPP